MAHERIALPRVGIQDVWRSACDDLARAYELWAQASRPDRASAYAAFVAAADREAAAAAHLESARHREGRRAPG